MHNDPAALSRLLQGGLSHHQDGRLAAAAAAYRAVLAMAPDHADALHLLGLATHQQGDSPSAVNLLAGAVRERPDVGHFHGNLGVACLAAGDLARAERCFRQALALQPDDADFRHNLGLTLLRLDRLDEAAECLRACLARAPGSVDARVNLAACLRRQGRSREAELALRAALRLAPGSLPALGALAGLLVEDGRAEEAERCYRTALAVRPDDAASLNNLGNLLRHRGRWDEAEASLRAAVRAEPTHTDALCNLGDLLAARGEIEEAESCFLAALRLRPHDADAQYGLGALCLATGRYSQGWEGFERRWARRGFRAPRRFVQPRWQGRAWPGQTLLLHGEQGLGDSIQMLRFVPELARRGAIVLELPRTLVRLAAAMDTGACILPAGEPMPAFDLQCPLMSLPYALGVTLETLPAAPYLSAPACGVARWRARLAGLAPFRVGIAWAGNPAYPADARRSIAPTQLSALADIPGIVLVSLQKGGQAAPAAVTDWTDELHDMADTAALVAALDLVISVDTAVVHLAGALGRPTWLLNRFDSCWRWMRDRDDSPWYPGLRQFRQAAPGDWDGVIARVRAALLKTGSDNRPTPSAKARWTAPSRWPE